jgi:hypothetical protein
LNPAKTTGHVPSRFGVAAWALALAVVAVTLGGLGIVFSHAFDLVKPSFPGETPVAGASMIAGLMVAFGSLTVVGIVAMLIWLFSRFFGAQTHSPAAPRRQAAEQKPAQIAPPPMSSVTEQTTRNFDPAIYRDRESS